VGDQSITVKEMKTILKFDTGADGFKRMVYIMVVIAALILGFGIYFLIAVF